MSRRSTAFFQTLTALTLLVLLAGCSSLSPYSKVTKVNLKLTGSDQLNLTSTAARRRSWCGCSNSSIR